MRIKIAILGLLIFFGTLSPAFAVRTDFDQIYTTDGFGSFTPKGTDTDPYALTDIPWLYLKLSRVADNETRANWGLFMDLSGGQPGETGSDQSEYWLQPFPDWAGFLDLVGLTEPDQQGLFQVTTSSCYDGDGCPNAATSNYDFGSALFFVGRANPTVTPEPASMALFGLGAGALGLTRRFRRKK